MNNATRDELMDYLGRASTALYVAVDKVIADDLSPKLKAARAMLEADGKRIAENETLRTILSRCATAIGNGAVMSPDCSIEFMANLPSEIAAHTDKLRRFLKCSRDEGGEAIARAESAERALAEERERHQWRDISTAPKGGAPFLAWEGAERGPFKCWMHQGFSPNEYYWMDCQDSEPYPTHWQPLPDATAIRAGKEEGR